MNQLNHNNYYCLIAAGGLKCKMFPKKFTMKEFYIAHETWHK